MSDIFLELGGERVALRCTLRAAKEINSFFGSYTAAYRKLIEYDLSAYVAIIAAGIGRKPSEVEKAIFEVGMPDLASSLTEYLNLLCNGGKPFNSEAKAATGEG